jgi:hypothetical protein
MDEHMVVSGGSTVTFDGGFADHNLNDLDYFTDKHNRYATREAIQVLGSRLALFDAHTGMTRENSSFHTSTKRLVKERLYNRVPFTISSLGYFLYRYIIQLGFLDGRSGLVYHFLQGFWYRFLVGAKLMELENSIVHLNDKEEIRKELSRLTGLNLVGRNDPIENSQGARSPIDQEVSAATLSPESSVQPPPRHVHKTLSL